jgi:tetratricopeptide (TPR) repeat protein
MRKLFIWVLVFCVLGVGGFAGYRGYKIWKQKHLMKMARDYVAKSDGRSALLSVEQALRSNPRNLEAVRMMADFAEMAGAPTAVFWRGRVVELDPDSFTNRMEWARSAVAAGDAPTAQKALEGVDPESKKTSLYHRMAGAVAIASKDLTNAEVHFVEVSRLEPTNPVPRLNLAVLRLQSTNVSTVNAARATLVGLCADRRVRVDALRQVELEAVRREDLTAALGYSTELLKETNAMFSDRLLHLAILRGAKNPQAVPFLVRVQQESADDPTKIYAVSKWMLGEGQAAQALTWMQGLPAQSVTNGPVPMIRAECHVAARDWVGLQKTVTSQGWGELEFLREAYNTRALRELGSAVAAKAEWADAMKAIGGRLDRAALLLRTVVAWKWTAEQEDVLWVIVNRFPKEKWAFLALAERLSTAGNTQGLLTLYRRIAEAEPANLAIKNNLALTALLLGALERRPHELALEVYTRDSTNPFYASTYGYSLYAQRKTNDALRVFEKLSAQQLQDPGIAAYYGLVLEGNGQAGKARPYLELAAQARLLPEEKKMIDQARGRL